MLSLFSESQHCLKDNNFSLYRRVTFRGYIFSIFQLGISACYSLWFFVRFSKHNVFQHLNPAISFRPLNKNVNSSQYFYRFIDFSNLNVCSLYVQTNSPSSYILCNKIKLLYSISLSTYCNLLLYLLILIPLHCSTKSSLGKRLVCDPSAIRNLFLYYTSIYIFETFNLPPSVLSTFEGHAWEYSILLAYSNTFRGNLLKNFISYQHAPLTFNNSSHLHNPYFTRFCDFRKVLPSGPSVANSFINYNLYTTGTLSCSYGFKQLVTEPNPQVIPSISLPPVKSVLCVPEAIDYELDIFCQFILSVHNENIIFSIRVQNIYFDSAYTFIKSTYPELLSLLVSSDSMALLDHCNRSNICITRGSSAAIECVQNGLVPVYLVDLNGYTNNVFWPIQNILGFVYPNSSYYDLDKAIDTSTVNISKIIQFSNSYYVPYTTT